MELQDEVDRHATSLWALQTEVSEEEAMKKKYVNVPNDKSLKGIKKVDRFALSQKTSETDFRPENISANGLKLDEDCLACSLEKYRPTIKEAFKMACI